jgi:hypothetical protein
MTAASYTLRSFAPPARTIGRLRRAFAALCVCLPVPICAASGLSLPLPAPVERIAAALVPWVDAVAMSANEALRPGAAGSIVSQTDERSIVLETDERGAEGNASFAADVTVAKRNGRGRARILAPEAVAVARPMRGEAAVVASTLNADLRSNPAARNAPAAQPVAEPVDSGLQPQPAPVPEPTPSASPATDTPAPAPPTTTTRSDPEPAPPPTTSDPDPVAPVKEAVSDVTAPLAPVVETTTDKVSETVAPVTELLPGLGK